MRILNTCLWCSAAMAFATSAAAGPFTNVGVDASDPALVAWAESVPSFLPTPSGGGVSASVLGPADGVLVSLGDLDALQIAAGDPLGEITLEFDSLPIKNGLGWDFAVFENAFVFPDLPFFFAELAYVEVSSNGLDFARFPSISFNVEPVERSGNEENELVTDFGRNFASLNVTKVYNLAGIHPTGVGTRFDLADLLDEPGVTGGLVDLGDVHFVRLVDVPGDGSFLDTEGRPILDAWVTTGSGGLDLDAVGARYVVPEPSSAVLMALAAVGLLAMRRVRRSQRGSYGELAARASAGPARR